MKIEGRCHIKNYLQKNQKNDNRYDYKVKLSWQFRTMTDIWEDDFYTAFLKLLKESRFYTNVLLANLW